MDSASFYEEYAQKNFAQVESEKVKALAQKLLKSPVLDVGCYFGEKTAWLAEHFDDVEGCDISQTAIEKARTTHPHLTFFPCDFSTPVRLPKKFNSIFAVEVIEHVFDTERFLANCRENLNPEGILFLTTPNVIQLLARVRLLFGDETSVCGDKAHIRFFKPQTIREALGKAGFDVIHLSGYNVKPFLQILPLPTNLCEGIIAAGKKR